MESRRSTLRPARGPVLAPIFLGATLSLSAALSLGTVGCSRKEAADPPIPVLFPAAYTDTTLEFPQVRFADGSLTPNDRCPVRKVKLNRRLQPLFVNGLPIGFC